MSLRYRAGRRHPGYGDGAHLELGSNIYQTGSGEGRYGSDATGGHAPTSASSAALSSRSGYDCPGAHDYGAPVGGSGFGVGHAPLTEQALWSSLSSPAFALATFVGRDDAGGAFAGVAVADLAELAVSR